MSLSAHHDDAIPSVSVHDAATASAEVALIDVREADEWATGHAPTARHLPLGRLHPDRLPAAAVLHVVCRSGGRSARAVAALRGAGYDAHNVAGGMAAWETAGLPVVRSDGQPGTIA